MNQRRDHYRVARLPKPTVNLPISLLRRAAPGRGPGLLQVPADGRRKTQLLFTGAPSQMTKSVKTFNNGSLGSGIDEERSEMR